MRILKILWEFLKDRQAYTSRPSAKSESDRHLIGYIKGLGLESRVYSAFQNNEVDFRRQRRSQNLEISSQESLLDDLVLLVDKTQNKEGILGALRG